MENKIIASISICGEMILNLHSLNNEGSEGNQTMPRQLTIFNKDGEDKTVTGISGDMFKHINVEHLVNYCTENNLSLSNYSKKMDPNRISVKELKEEVGKLANNQEDVINALIKKCVVCDTHGVLITEAVGGSENTSRKSVIEFAWTVGIPGKNNTETYIHTKLVANVGKKSNETTASNEGQNLFYRPANHGAYAFICNIDVYRIGLNDITRTYAIEDEERINRYKAILLSLLSTILNPKGAMTSMQKPHITNFQGVVTVSHKLLPSPTISAINPNYINELEVIKENLNKIQKGAIEIKAFDNLGGLSEIIAELFLCTPYKIQ